MQIEVTGRSLPQMWDEFSKFQTSVRSITMNSDQSTLALKTVLHLPDPKPDDKSARKEALEVLTAEFATRLTGYRQELGENAYAVFNTLTDIAARPPAIACFLTDSRHHLASFGPMAEGLGLAESSQRIRSECVDFSIGGSSGSSIPGKN